MLFEVEVEVEVEIEAVIGIEIGIGIGIFATSSEEVGVVESCVEYNSSNP